LGNTVFLFALQIAYCPAGFALGAELDFRRNL